MDSHLHCDRARVRACARLQVWTVCVRGRPCVPWRHACCTSEARGPLGASTRGMDSRARAAAAVGAWSSSHPWRRGPQSARSQSSSVAAVVSATHAFFRPRLGRLHAARWPRWPRRCRWSSSSRHIARAHWGAPLQGALHPPAMSSPRGAAAACYPGTRARDACGARRGFPAAAAAAGFRACAQGADRGTHNVEPYRIHNRIQPHKSNRNSTNAQTVALPLACPFATGSWSSSQSWRRPQPAWASPGVRLVGAAAASRGAETFVSSPTARQSAIANPLADGRLRGMNACPARISLCYSRLERDSASPLQSCPGN